MPLSEDQITGHGLWASLDALDESLNESGRIAGDEVAAKLTLLPMVSAEVRALRDVPPWRFPSSFTGFTDIQTQVDALTQAVTTATTTEDEAQAAAAATQLGSQLDAGLDAISSHLNVSPRTAPSGEATTEAVRRMGDLVEGRSQQLRAEHEQLAEQIAERQAELAQLQTAITQAESGVTAQVATMESTIEQLETAHQTRVQQWQSEHQERLAQNDADAETERQNQEQKSEEQRTGLAERGDATLVELDKLHEQAKSVVGKTAERATVTDFENYANREERSGTIWSIVTVMLGLAAVISLVYFVSKSHEGSVGLAALKAGGSLALIGLMAFTAQQVRHHQREAQDARGIALSVKAAAPFVADMDVDDQRRIKEAIAMELFVRRFAKDRTEPQSPLPSLPGTATDE